MQGSEYFPRDFTSYSLCEKDKQAKKFSKFLKWLLCISFIMGVFLFNRTVFVLNTASEIQLEESITSNEAIIENTPWKGERPIEIITPPFKELNEKHTIQSQQNIKVDDIPIIPVVERASPTKSSAKNNNFGKITSVVVLIDDDYETRLEIYSD